MFDGSSVEITAIHSYSDGTQLKSNTVRITRGNAEPDPDKPSLELSAEKLTFDPDNAAVNIIEVECNTTWSASTEDAGLRFSPASGQDDGVIVVTAAPANKTSVITVIAGEGEDAVTKRVEVTYEVSVPAETIYYDNFDQTSFKGWADGSAAWQNPTGPGAAGVTYACYRTWISSDSYGSQGRYPGASGGNYVRVYFDREPYFVVNDIALTPDQTNLTLSLGGSFTASDCLIQLSKDGVYWKKIDYTGAKTYNTWEQISVDFTLAEPAERLFIRLTPQGSQNYGVNFDDMRLSTGPGGQSVSLAKPVRNYRWAELPAGAVSAGDYVVNTHWAETVKSKQWVRNFTYCYDTRRHCPLWIAHPQHACYQESSGRTDVWAKDPYMSDDQQAIMYPLLDVTGQKALSLYSESVNKQWGRGHMLMSNYRGGPGSDLNAQTFYSSNIAPQNGAAFDKLWRDAELKIQDNYVCADTLYCISGAYFENDNLVARDASYGYGENERYYIPNFSKECIVPTHYYKLIVRTRSGNSGKAIQECDASELKAVGFWFTHADVDPISGLTSPTLSSAYMMSMKQIEQKTGITFFPDVPESVKEQCNPTDWGF